MTFGRNVALPAAMACMLSSPFALLSGVVQAQELPDSQTKSQMVQQRVDQLAQGIPSPAQAYPGGPPPPSAGQGLVGGSFPRSFLIPGTDTSIRLGGEIRESFVYWFNGGNPNASPFSTTVGVNGQAQAIPLNQHFSAGVGGAVLRTENPARSRSGQIFGMSPRESKLHIETRTPTAFGEARTYMEFDWAGSTAFSPGGGNPTSVSDNLSPRLRFAYGTLGGFLAGQANSNFSDPDANAEVLDFGGTFGDPGVVRVPQVRYTVPLERYGFLGAVSVSAETPETDAWTPGTGIIGQDAGAVTSTVAATTTGLPPGSTVNVGGVVTSAPIVNPLKTPAPDLTAAWYIPQPWGHIDFSAVVRPALQVKDGRFVDRTFVGYGGHVGFDVKPGWFGWDRDGITFQAVGGDALGRYLNSSTNFALITNYPGVAPASAAAAANVLIKPSREYGGNIGYRHFWAPNLRSTINAGVNYHDIPRLETSGTPVCVSRTTAAFSGAGGCGLNSFLFNAHANLIWNPVAFAEFGIEYTFAQRQVVSGVKGDMNAMIGRFRVTF